MTTGIPKAETMMGGEWTEVYACPECDSVHWFITAEEQLQTICALCGWAPQRQSILGDEGD